MLASVLFAVLAAGQLALAARCVLRIRRTGDGLPIVPAMVCAALAYDNAVLAAGRWIGAGATLEGWSAPRFVAHIVLTPLLMPWACAAAVRAGVGWCRARWVRAAVWAVTAAVIVLGVLGELTPLTLEPREWAGTVRYTTAHASAAGVLPPVVTVLVVLVAAVAVWRARGYRLWTVTTVIMTVVSAAMPPMLLTNCAELVFTSGVVATAIWLSQPSRSSGSGAAAAP
ncbi:hypothetical protein [Nocardia jinanensis]|uniref:Uncharacterized protein n=1 Tax=Nocardia jinanensis TaxID=382504 RepID=A0A917VY08_9NOCA|nr:hypothetical protein [Nocardia jinanensis]GGL43702.1 hypothetical protein GCM10011588_68090 [Nocardia jinanensis]